MKKIIMERGHGKTTQLIFLSSKTNTPIITPFYKEHIKELAKELDVEIPEPLTLRELDNRCLKGTDVLVDNAEYVLDNILLREFGVRPVAISITPGED